LRSGLNAFVSDRLVIDLPPNTLLATSRGDIAVGSEGVRRLLRLGTVPTR